MTADHGSDYERLGEILRSAADAAAAFHGGLAVRPVAAPDPRLEMLESLSATGPGAEAALANFRRRFGDRFSASAGPRYWAFVTGGTTPAALVGDWYASAIDQNVGAAGDSVATGVTRETLARLMQLFDLPADRFGGAFCTGGTAANVMGLMTARQWAGDRAGVDVAVAGLAAAPPIRLFAGCPHASLLKAMAILGLGRDALVPVARLPDREAIDPEALDAALAATPAGVGKIVSASAATVTGNDFDDLERLADLCARHEAWLHVDAAFGLFARCVPELAPLCAGVERADSIAADGHKWLNVPYDSGFWFTARTDLAEAACRLDAAYLDTGSPEPPWRNRAVESSQRFRALPAWMTLEAYGAQGVRQVVRDNCRQARLLAEWIENSDAYDLLAPVRLNVVCFRALPPAGTDGDAWNRDTLLRIQRDGRVFMTPGAWGGKSGIRAAFSNWMTSDGDVGIATDALADIAADQRRGA